MDSQDTSSAFEAVFQSVSDCVLVSDTSCRLMKVNRRTCEFFGYMEHELLGRDVDMLIPGAFAREDCADVQNDLETSEPNGRDVTGRTKDGALVPLGLTVNEAVVEGQRVVISTLRDISNRKESEQSNTAVAESDRMLRLVADSLPVLIAYFGTDLRYRFVNRTAERWYARDAGEILGRRVGEVLGGGMESAIQSHLQAAAQGQTVRFEKRLGYPDGVTRDVEIYYVPELDIRLHRGPAAREAHPRSPRAALRVQSNGDTPGPRPTQRRRAAGNDSLTPARALPTSRPTSTLGLQPDQTPEIPPSSPKNAPFL